MHARTILGVIATLAIATFAGGVQAAPPGPEVCKGCHEPYFNSLAATPHGKAGHPMSPAANAGCATCQGDGTKHVEAGGGRGVGGIINPASKSIPAVEKDRMCLSCHESQRHLAFWD